MTLQSRLKLHLILQNKRIFDENFDFEDIVVDTTNILLFPFLKHKNIPTIRDKFIRKFYSHYLKCTDEEWLKYCSNNFYNSVVTSIIDLQMNAGGGAKHLNDKLREEENERLVTNTKLQMKSVPPNLNDNRQRYIINQLCDNNNNFFDLSLKLKNNNDNAMFGNFFETYNIEHFLRKYYPHVDAFYSSPKVDKDMKR